MRLLLPHLDNMRQRYLMQQKRLADTYIELLELPESAPDARKLREYKVKARTMSEDTGDFPAILYEVLSARAATVGAHKRDWTLQDVNAWLDELADRGSDVKVRMELFQKLMAECKPLEHKWLVREILRDMKLGVRQDSIFNWYHPDAQECFNATLDLQAVFLDPTLRDPAMRRRFNITVGRPFAPMAAERLVLHEEARDLLAGADWQDFFAERKLDGERVMIHKMGDVVKVYTRNSLSYDDYASILGPYVLARVKAKEAILDGEMMAFDESSGDFIPFGENRTVVNEEVCDRLILV